MASRSYNPSPFPISNTIEDTLEYYNMRKNPNSQPMIFKYPPKVVIRDTPPQRVERLYGGGRSMKMLEMDEKEPMRRPAGFVEPHSSGSSKYISNGNSATYPVFNAVEQKAIDGKKVGGTMGKFGKDQNSDRVIDKMVRHPKDPNLVMVGDGLFQELNKFGKNVENTAKGILNSSQVKAIINDPKVRALANKGKDLALAEIQKKVGSGSCGSGVKRGRGRPRKCPMEGEGILDDMNKFGKNVELGFNRFGKNVENTAKGILNNPQVKAVMNDPAVQKLGKSAIKTAVSYIPVVGPPAATALGLIGFGGAPRATIVKQIMAEKNMSMIEASKYVKANNLYQAKPKTPRGKK